MTPNEIITEAEKFNGWYHEIELTPGYTTRSYMGIQNQWAMVRRVRTELNYTDQAVLDVGTMDGMWAFEAEKLGASEVHTCDIWQDIYGLAQKRFALAHKALESKVQFTRDSVEELTRVTRDFSYRFDIIQFLGVFYHVENPMRALRRLHDAARMGTWMLFESAIWNDDGPPMGRFNSDSGIYADQSTYWALNPKCLFDMLNMTGWQPLLSTVQKEHEGKTDRICLICKAV